MWEKFLNFYKSASSFLQNGQSPPGTPDKMKPVLDNVNHLASKKFFITFTALFAIALFYFTSVGILFFLPHTPEIITGFVTIFCKVLEIISIVIATYVGAQAAVDLRYNSNSAASLEGIAQSISENTNYTEKIIEEGSKNAPEKRPFSQYATDDLKNE